MLYIALPIQHYTCYFYSMASPTFNVLFRVWSAQPSAHVVCGIKLIDREHMQCIRKCTVDCAIRGAIVMLMSGCGSVYMQPLTSCLEEIIMVNACSNAIGVVSIKQ